MRAKAKDEIITRRVKDLLAELKLTTTQAARQSKIDQPQMSRMMNGKAGWSMRALEKLSQGLKVDLAYFTSDLPPEKYELMTIPIVAEYRDGGFDWRLITTKHPIDHKLIAVEREGKVLGKIYGIRMQDDLGPGFPPGCVLRAQMDTWEDVKAGDLVAFPRESGKVDIRRITRIKDDSIHLDSLNPDGESIVLPIAHKRLMHRIIGVDF